MTGSAGFPGADEMRIGTEEREDAVRVLGEHLAVGRLDTAEYQQRAAAAGQASTRGDVKPLFTDLPEPHPYFLLPARQANPFFGPVTPYASRQVTEYSDRSRVIAGVLQIVLPFGAGRFYTGQAGLALAQLFVTLFTFGAGAIWPFIDGVILLARGGIDAYGRPLHD